MSRRQWKRIARAGALVMALALLSGPALAQQGPGYIYSYEQAQIGDTPQWVLVPKPMPKALSSDLETNVRAVVGALQKAKRPTYGRTSVYIDPAELEKGRVTIEVDKDKIKYQLIIEAEIVASLAPLGINQVTFKGDGEVDVTPTDVPFTTFLPTLPIWRALPPATAALGLVQMPDGSVVELDAFQGRLKKGERDTVEAVYASLDKGAPLAKLGIIERLPELKLKGWEDAVARRLDDRVTEVRVAAVDALRGVPDKDILERLTKVMDQDDNPEVKDAAANCLSASDNKKYSVYGAYHAMRSEDTATAISAIDELVEKGVDDAGPELIEALSHPKPSVARRAARALRELGLEDDLAKALKSDLRPEIAQQVALEMSQLKSRDDAAIGLAWLAAKGTPEAAAEAITTLQGMRDPDPVPALEAALASPHPESRLAAASALAAREETDSVAAIMEVARAHPDEAFDIEQTVVRLLANAEKLSDLEDRLKGRDPLIKRSVYMALGRRAHDADAFDRVRETLTEGIGDADPVARGGAILGLATAADPDDLLVLSPLVSASEDSVRVDVARALSMYPAGQAQDALLKLLEDSSEDVVIAAIQAFGKRKETAVQRNLTKLGKNPSTRIRKALLKAVAEVAAGESRPDALSFIANALFDNELEVKLTAIQTLGRFNDPQAVESLALLVQDPDTTLKHATFRALGATQHPDAISLIAQGLGSDDAETRRVAIEALGVHANPAVQVELETHIPKESDPELKKLAESLLQKLRS